MSATGCTPELLTLWVGTGILVSAAVQDLKILVVDMLVFLCMNLSTYQNKTSQVCC